ncbi:ABC transporter ATP-binding protein [Corynebacterium sp. sy017]|uniref:ATP-binding cassette domain-containing protein n=1 Tax=unclassified Corynebacterium TaxID=2624378 RepID=UPI0011869091|nr:MULTISPECIES: ABC transporter ATP-binding protein [unclassified Corynebacterium]MBP3089085.1 ABC transporter ATP-binding protein [Corynebacterium sp. sy017]TSD91400.1 ABC transporter ATP-binding protein [Corynebacterium sp. SY003]
MILKITRYCKDSKVRFYIFGCALFSIIFTVSSVLQPSLLSKLIDGTSVNGLSGEFVIQTIILLLVVVITTAANALLTWQEDRLTATIRYSLQREIIQKSDIDRLHVNSAQSIQVLIGDTAIVSNYIAGLISKLAPGLGMFLFALVELLQIDTVLTLLVIGIGLALTMLSFPFFKRMAQSERTIWESRDTLSSTLLNYFAAGPVAKLNGRLEHIKSTVYTDLTRLRRASEKSATIKAQFTPFNNSIIPILAVCTLGIASWRIQIGEITNGDLVAFLMYMFILITPLLRALSIASQRTKANTAWVQIKSMLNSKSSKGVLPKRVNHVIEKHLGTLLRSSGSLIIIGPSGIGKTTLLKEMSNQLSGKEVAYVSQDPQLLPSTIKDTLLLYSDENSSELFLRNLVTLRLPNLKLDTAIAGMSGGERQRIVLAAALASNKRTIILDEPTSSLGIDDQRHLITLIKQQLQSRDRMIISTHNSEFIDWLTPNLILEIESNDQL